MKKILTLVYIFLIATASYAQVQSVNSDERKINDYKSKPGGYQRLISDYQKIPETQERTIEDYMRIPANYQRTSPNNERTLKEGTYTVERVINGDTIKLTNGERVHLIGVELKTMYKMGQETTEFVKSLGLEGKEVLLEFDVGERDKYGRLVAYVFIDTIYKEGDLIRYPITIGHHYDYYNGHFSHFLNATIIKSGYATPMTFPPNVKYADLFKELYEEAKEKKRGLWVEKPYNNVDSDLPPKKWTL